jgi:hypothetical protein
MRCLILLILIVVLPPIAAGSEAEALPEGQSFGAPMTLSRPTPLSEVLGEPARFSGRPLLVRGRISDVCQKKGCWTILRDGDATVRVRFHDYGFFLPKDSIGAEAWAEGTVSLVTLSEKEARHYEAESRDGDPSEIQGPQQQVGFMATGIRLVEKPQ